MRTTFAIIALLIICPIHVGAATPPDKKPPAKAIEPIAFPDGVVDPERKTAFVTSPKGGIVLWVQMPENVDSLELYSQAIKAKITLAPGYLFSPTPKYKNFIRLNAAYWSYKAERAIQVLGEMVEKIAKG